MTCYVMGQVQESCAGRAVCIMVQHLLQNLSFLLFMIQTTGTLLRTFIGNNPMQLVAFRIFLSVFFARPLIAVSLTRVCRLGSRVGKHHEDEIISLQLLQRLCYSSSSYNHKYHSSAWHLREYWSVVPTSSTQCPL